MRQAYKLNEEDTALAKKMAEGIYDIFVLQFPKPSMRQVIIMISALALADEAIKGVLLPPGVTAGVIVQNDERIKHDS